MIKSETNKQTNEQTNKQTRPSKTSSRLHRVLTTPNIPDNAPTISRFFGSPHIFFKSSKSHGGRSLSQGEGGG